jgi:lipoprotein-releasing system permease protein
VTSPFIDGQGIILNSDISEPVSFVGVRPLQEARVTDFQKNVIRGTPVDLAQQSNGIILGTILADNLRVQIGDRVTLISQEGISRRFLVVGIYSAEIREVDQVRAYMNLRQAQLLMDMRGISGIGVRTTSLDIALPVAEEIEKETDYTAESWREVNANTLNLFTTISMIVYLIVGLTMLVAGFGIANTLILTVNEKTKDIGILKAIGVPAQRITLLFLCVGILIGILGVVIGELLGMTGIAILARTPLPFQPTGQFSAPGEAQTFPVLRTPRVFIVSGAFGLLISFFSGVMPSLRAAKSDPIQVIREAE